MMELMYFHMVLIMKKFKKILLLFFAIFVIISLIGNNYLEKKYMSYYDLSITCSYCYKKDSLNNGTVYINTNSHIIGFFDKNVKFKEYPLSKLELYFYLMCFENIYRAQGEAKYPYSEYICIEKLGNDSDPTTFFDRDLETQRITKYKHSCIIGNSTSAKMLVALMFMGLYLRMWYLLFFTIIVATVYLTCVAVKRCSTITLHKQYLLSSFCIFALLMLFYLIWMDEIKAINATYNLLTVSKMNYIERFVYETNHILDDKFRGFGIQNYIIFIIAQTALIFKIYKEKYRLITYPIISLIITYTIYLFHQKLIYVNSKSVSYKFLQNLMDKLYLVPTSNPHIMVFFGFVFFCIALLLCFLSSSKKNKMWDNLIQSVNIAFIFAVTILFPCFIRF